jgi:hypothetical protein
MNIFVGYLLIKIRIPRGIGQFPLGSGPYSLYDLTYGSYKHGWITTTSKE